MGEGLNILGPFPHLTRQSSFWESWPETPYIVQTGLDSVAFLCLQALGLSEYVTTLYCVYFLPVTQPSCNSLPLRQQKPGTQSPLNWIPNLRFPGPLGFLTVSLTTRLNLKSDFWGVCGCVCFPSISPLLGK